jgi:hypothetical protein
MRSFIRIAAIFFSFLITLLAIAAAFIIFTPQGASMALERVTARVLGPGNVVYERLEGSLIRGVKVFNMEVRRPVIFRTGTLVRVQELQMRLVRFSIDGLDISLVNARILDPKADPLVIDGSFSGGHYALNAYTGSLQLDVLRQVIKHFRNPPILQGELKALDLVLSGNLSRPALKGKFVVDHIPQHGFLLRDAPVEGDLYFMRSGGLWGTYGRMWLHGGWLKTPRTVVRLGECALTFDGDPLDPQLDIHGTAHVGRVLIQITVKGTRKDPHVDLSSDASLPQEQLMLMLTTGKRWDSLSGPNVVHKMTPELAGDFVDYFFFGGAGAHVAKFLGLSGISYKIDGTTQGVTFNKDLFDRLGVGYGVVLSTTGPEGRKEVMQTMESEFRLNEKVTVSAQKEVLPIQRTGAVLAPRRIPDDRVYLKYRTQF